jgi:hypothetical protein
MNKSALHGQILIPFTHSSYLLPDDLLVGLPESSGGQMRSLHLLFISPPRFYVLVYHLGDVGGCSLEM